MPGVCTHEFFWPLRAADGHYYQVCRRCGAQSEYDWTSMHRVDAGPEATLAHGVSGPKGSTRSESRPRLNLLVELEPAHRVFLRNLADVFRRTPADATGLPPMPFWRELFFHSDIPWQRFAESMVCHMIALAVVLVLSRMQNSRDFPRQRSMFENSHLTYYKPDASFPALRGSPARSRPAAKKQAGSAPSGSIRVAPERAAQGPVNPPDIKLKGPARPNIEASSVVPPAAPLASTTPSRLTVPMGPTSIVAPPPEVNQAMSGRLGLPQASGVAPAPEPGVISSRRAIAMAVPGAAVIGPPPELQASTRRAGDINIGPAAVVAPAPRLPVGEQSSASGAAALGSPVAWAVPPPPSAPSSGTLGRGRPGSLTGAGLQVVPPPSAPSSGSLASGRLGSLAGTGLQVVAPPPSVQDVGNATSGGGRLSSLAGGSLSGGALSSTGEQAVPPAPSLQGAGNSGPGQRGSSLSGTGFGSGVQGVAPAPSVGAGGDSDHGGRQVAMNASPSPAPPSPSPVTETAEKKAEEEREPATQEMPLRLIGLAMALPNSSYFSNYEVYIAERPLRKNLTELVKLVYVYLPYQRRLSEYGVDNSKIYKLRVSRDRSCDESLMQMTWPETDPHPDAQNAADSPALSASDRKSMLPCYRTTADDYRKAISRR